VGRIFYSLSGEGRGHASRAIALVSRLMAQHEVTLFTFGDALDLLAPWCKERRIPLVSIPGLRFRYHPRRLALRRTALAGLKYLSGQLPGLVRLLSEKVRRESPDLVITDFEPALPRAAERCGVPFVSLNHQHFLVVNDLSSLPAHLRWYGDFMGLVVRGYCSGQARTIVSSFYFPPLKRAYRERAVQVGVLLRPEVLAARPSREGHLVAYLRRFTLPQLLEALRSCGLPVRVYGLGDRPEAGPLTFKGVSTGGFLEDLASSEALVCTAGNQLLGEALYLGKPVLALPEPGNFEQRIHAHFLRQSGAGDWSPMESMDDAGLKRFLSALDGFRARLPGAATDGTPATLAALEPFLV
jgi:uncharacterized protein (TIGR00661 family)